MKTKIPEIMKQQNRIKGFQKIFKSVLFVQRKKLQLNIKLILNARNLLNHPYTHNHTQQIIKCEELCKKSSNFLCYFIKNQIFKK